MPFAPKWISYVIDSQRPVEHSEFVNHNISRLIALFGVIGQLNGFATGQTPDFRLVDMNTKSERYMAPVSPRDYLLQVSGYYFGWAG